MATVVMAEGTGEVATAVGVMVAVAATDWLTER